MPKKRNSSQPPSTDRLPVRVKTAKDATKKPGGQNGQRFTAPFPAPVTKAVQYGNGVKAHAGVLPENQAADYQCAIAGY